MCTVSSCTQPFLVHLQTSALHSTPSTPHSASFSWIYTGCILCLCTQPTETTSISLCVTGTSIRGMQPSFFYQLNYSLLTPFFPTMGHRRIQRKREGLCEQGCLFKDTNTSDEGLHQHFYGTVCKTTSPLSFSLPLRYHLHSIRTQISMTTHEMEQGTDHTKRQFKLI